MGVFSFAMGGNAKDEETEKQIQVDLRALVKKYGTQINHAQFSGQETTKLRHVDLKEAK